MRGLFRRRHSQGVSKLRRYRIVIGKLIAYGFDDFLVRLGIIKGPGILRRFQKRREASVSPKDPMAVRLRFMLEDLGPTFIKLGQILSLRSDILPKIYTEELAQLQTRALPLPAEKIRAEMEESFGSPLDTLFREFDPEPIASASIAQVHRCVTVNGTSLAVKVRRPGITRLVETDLEILRDLAVLAERYIPSLKIYSPVKMVDEFSRSIRMELDFLHEGRAFDLFRKSFAEEDDIVIPRIYWDYTNSRVLSMQYIRGATVGEYSAAGPGREEARHIADMGVRYILTQIFEFGFFNADPHPGNFIITPEGRLAPVDFGMVGFIDREMKGALFSLLEGFLRRDPNKIVQTFLRMDIIEEETSIQDLRHDLNNLINYYYNIPVSHLRAGKMIEDLTGIIRTYRISLPADFALTLKVILTAESLGQDLDPEYNIIEAARPFVRRYMAERLKPGERLSDSMDFLTESLTLIRGLPNDASLILKKLRTGKMKLEVEVRGLDTTTRELDKSFNRLAFSIVIAGLLVGSSFMNQAEGCVRIFGFSLIALAGYTLAGFLGLWLIIGIIRSGRI
jgi:ubiquinone biosynthesis protein